MKKLPIGIQTFEKIINDNYLYVDKTEYMYNFINRGSYFFLSRPRRFGKSLLISTLKELFSSNKELFKNLWIYSSNYVWHKHPVITLDFSIIAHRTPEQFESSLIEYLLSIASEHEIAIAYKTTPEGVLAQLVKSLFDKLGPVVILIDEYDKPILDHIHDLEVAQNMQEVLRSFYATIKGLDAYIRFMFMTGVTKFSKTSVFSGLNNLQDLTLESEAGALLGYTQAEVDNYFAQYINTIAHAQSTTAQAIREQAKLWYNGYQFSRQDIKVYNPYSLLSYFSSGYLSNYWFETGTPTFLINLIKAKHYPIENLEQSVLSSYEMGSFDIGHIELLPLLLQTGYLTITDYDTLSHNYTLDYPNEETRISFLQYFISNITSAPITLFHSSAVKLAQALKTNNLELFFQTLQVYFAAIPYNIQLAEEKYYQTVFYVIVSLIGAYVQAEVATNAGRIDAIIETHSHVYIFEFKLNKSAEAALEQIKDKRYYQKYLHSGKHIVLVGANFSLTKRNIDQWLVEEAS